MAGSIYAKRKSAARYLPPSDRPGCRNCRHRSEVASVFGDGTGYECRLGRFLVSLGGICDSHTPAGVAGLKPPGEPHEKL